MSMVYISIGLFASSVTNNQIVAFLLSLFIGVFFLIIFSVLSSDFTGLFGEILDYLNLSTHFESISRGVIDSKDIIYFLSISFFGLILAEAMLSKRNIVD
jgi:ABC-2 type transport system permease protein